MDATADDGVDSRPKYACSQCDKRYRRPEHLKRHQASHLSTRPHRCALCQASFQRSDLLRRHEKTCTGSMLKTGSSSRRACDQCVRSKKACNSLQPCLNCQRRQRVCTYGLSERDLGANQAEWLPDISDADLGKSQEIPTLGYMDLLSSDMLQESTESWQGASNAVSPGFWGSGSEWHEPSISCGQRRVALQFLERFTRSEGLIASFDCCTEEQRSFAREHFTRKQNQCHLEACDWLTAQCSEIQALVEEVITIKPRNSAVTQSWSAAVKDECASFFCPCNLSLYIELYWTVWSPNIPFLHRPTFDPRIAKPILLAAMAVIGASVSADKKDRSRAEFWFCCVEEAVFRDDEFYYDGNREASFPSKSKLQALQASYIVCLFQNWQGTDASKRRIRSFRYSTVVAVARDIGMVHARHPTYSPKVFPSFEWPKYVMREELIRTFLWIFLLDTAFVIFNRVPPRMAIKEMSMHLALSEGAFQATTRESCFQLLLSGSADARSNLTSYCEMLCKQHLNDGVLGSLADLGSLNLFVLTSALHSMIFQSQQVFGYDGQMTSVRTGLDNWILTWRMYVNDYSSMQKHHPLPAEEEQHIESMWQRIGFYHSADEYWMLARLMVHRIALSSQTEGDCMVHEGVEPVEVRVKEEPLEKYDETSMRQVNELIADFQRVLT